MSGNCPQEWYSGVTLVRLLLYGFLESWLHADRGEAGAVPTAAKGLDQKHRGREALPEDLGRQTLIVQQLFLCGDYIQIIHKSAAVASAQRWRTKLA